MKKIKTIFFKSIMILALFLAGLLLSIGFILYWISKLLRALGMLMMFHPDTAKDEITKDWFSYFISIKDAFHK